MPTCTPETSAILPVDARASTSLISAPSSIKASPELHHYFSSPVPTSPSFLSSSNELKRSSTLSSVSVVRRHHHFQHSEGFLVTPLMPYCVPEYLESFPSVHFVIDPQELPNCIIFVISGHLRRLGCRQSFTAHRADSSHGKIARAPAIFSNLPRAQSSSPVPSPRGAHLAASAHRRQLIFDHL